GDSDTKDVDSENHPEISSDIDQDYDSNNFTESGDEYNPFQPPDYNNRDPDYNPFQPPDYNNRDPDYNPFEPPDYNNKEETEDKRGEHHTGEEQNEFTENLSVKEENIEENLEDFSEPETKQQEEKVKDSDSELQEPKSEITSSVETENIGSEQITITLQQQPQEQIPEYEPKDKVDNIEIIDSESESLKPIQNEDAEINKIVLNVDKMEWETMEFFGHVSSHKEMEVELLEEAMEDLFNKYADKEIENLETSHEAIEENHAQEHEEKSNSEIELTQEQDEKENIKESSQIKIKEKEQELSQKKEQPNKKSQEIKQKHIAEGHQNVVQEEKSNLEIERTQEQDEKEDIKESSYTKIKEKEQELSQEIEQSNKKSQEIEKKHIAEGHQNVIQEEKSNLEIEQTQEQDEKEVQKKVEKQKEQLLKESDKFFNERYKQETGRRPIYAGKETKGFIEWKEYLEERKEKQEEKNKLLLEHGKDTKAKSKEIREYKEEWAQYLADSIKKSEFPEDIKEKLSNLLEKQENLRELLDRSKTKEISEEFLEKELRKFEDILIEKRNIAKPLFMNFDWFRRYYNEMIRISGKRVANLYISKKTREFLSNISGRIEQLENRENFSESAEKFEEFLDKSFQIREKWALLLNNLLREVPTKEISKEAKRELEAVIKRYCEIKAIQFNDKILKADKEKLIQGRIEKSYPRFFELFEILKRFLGIYGYYSRNWMEQSLIIAGKKTIRQLSQK
ncbi:hypothetical protein LCGC14_2007750, partial [marine sediment metagenome]